jgi:hypothetical protein
VKKALDRNQDAGNAHIVRRLRDEFTMRQAFGPKPGNAHIANELIMTRAFGPKVAPAGN